MADTPDAPKAPVPEAIKPSSTATMINMGSMLLIAYGGVVDLKNPQVVQLVQAVFALVATVVYLTNNSVPGRVKDDPTPVWFKAAAKPSLSSMFGGGSGEKPSWHRTTRGELERTLAKQKAGATLSQLMFPAFFTFYMKVHVMAAIQIITLLYGLFEDPLVRKYVLAPFGVPLPAPSGADLGVCGELSRPPKEEEGVWDDAAAEGGAPHGGGGRSGGRGRRPPPPPPPIKHAHPVCTVIRTYKCPVLVSKKYLSALGAVRTSAMEPAAEKFQEHRLLLGRQPLGSTAGGA
jgi:hypothetical protein